MQEQPRDENGRFVQIDVDSIQPLNDERTIGVTTDENVTPSLEMVNVDLNLLEEAIKKAKTHDRFVRLGIIRKYNQTGSKHEEKGLVCLKGSPHSDETVVLTGLTRTWDESSEYWQKRHGEDE